MLFTPYCSNLFTVWERLRVALIFAFGVLFSFFPLLNGFIQQIFYLAVEGAEIILSPGDQLFPERRRQPERNLLFFMVTQKSSLLSCAG